MFLDFIYHNKNNRTNSLKVPYQVVILKNNSPLETKTQSYAFRVASFVHSRCSCDKQEHLADYRIYGNQYCKNSFKPSSERR